MSRRTVKVELKQLSSVRIGVMCVSEANLAHLLCRARELLLAPALQ
jgi:hypothetical protein